MIANPSPELDANLYETDFYAWTQVQAKLLQQGAWQELDVVNLVEEIESLGRQERQELINRLGILLGHLLKWEFQPAARSKSWFATIREQRRRIARLLQQNPSLRPYLPEALTDAYPDSVDLVIRETPLRYRDLPSDCPYSLEQILDDRFLSGEFTDWDEWL
ncbi:MAG: DUF29 domain-containing protein [Elainella sp.]